MLILSTMNIHIHIHKLLFCLKEKKSFTVWDKKIITTGNEGYQVNIEYIKNRVY